MASEFTNSTTSLLILVLKMCLLLSCVPIVFSNLEDTIGNSKPNTLLLTISVLFYLPMHRREIY